MKRMLNARLGLSMALVVLLAACAKPPQTETPPTATETPAVVALPPAPPPAPTRATLPPPTAAEVRNAVARVYQDMVRVNTEGAPTFAVGDFNGDQVQDLAVVVEPVKEKLDELNSEVAPWRIRDPLTASLPPPVMSVRRNDPPPRVVITAGDKLLLAIIHGYGPQGWRDPEARQTLLLKNVVGDRLTVQPLRSALPTKGAPLRGDVIKTNVTSAAGFLYYIHSSYEWYNPRATRTEVAQGMMPAAGRANR
ncbi:MAG TPA: hypothetical protein VKA60_06520 [Blastocatellia bacterium]|nr:hypothetical protein [Blastocatellia bacterium]